jgi:hypothetical protein
MLIGRGGSDTLLAFGGSDTLEGGQGEDWVFGGNLRGPFGGPKVLSGGPGHDAVLGGTGYDTVVGGEGNDVLVDGPPREVSHDILQGGEGRDTLYTVNDPAFRDLVQCGGGFDRAVLDPKDVAQGCERKSKGDKKYSHRSRAQALWRTRPFYSCPYSRTSHKMNSRKLSLAGFSEVRSLLANRVSRRSLLPPRS